jgi:hypothetical protein
MQVSKVALGVIQQRGSTVVEPRLMTFGPDESDFLVRHIEKVRDVKDASARSVFTPLSNTPMVLDRLRTGSDGDFETAAEELQDALARSMRTATNAQDCVFAALRAGSNPEHDGHVTLLKLDAVVEAAQTTIHSGRVSLQVLKKLLPEPGKLQKALSWPDPRPVSDVIMVDRNVTSAQYFENAYQVQVSSRSIEAENKLVVTLTQSLPREQLGQAMVDAGRLDGPLDQVLGRLSETYPELREPAQAAASQARPAGVVRRNKVAARPLVWRADGAELKIPPELAGNVETERAGDGWRFTLLTRTEPRLDR